MLIVLLLLFLAVIQSVAGGTTARLEILEGRSPLKRETESSPFREPSIVASPLLPTTNDEECLALKAEFDVVCSSAPQKGAEKESKAFCDAYRSSCPIYIKGGSSVGLPVSISNNVTPTNGVASESDSTVVGENKGALIATNITEVLTERNETVTAKDDESCVPLKSEFDRICSVGAKGQTAAEIKAFCEEFRKQCTNLLLSNSKQGRGEGGHVQKGSQPLTPENEEEECIALKPQYVSICVGPSAQSKTIPELSVFCGAYRSQCGDLANTPSGELVDRSGYCKKHLTRFEYVCPNPLRFGKYTNDAVDFCGRYRERCPDQSLPSEPVSFHKKETHIYIREVEFLCTRYKHFAETYCANRIVLKLTKYAIPCALYKFRCIDVYTSVIYA